MAANVAYHVNGPALVWIGNQGVGGGLEQLGISEDGIGISLTQHDDPIMTDDGGSRIPDELQDMGEDATIDFRLVYYDLNVLRKIRKKRIGPALPEGQQRSRGSVIFNNDLGFRLVVQSDGDEPWRFFWCTLRNAPQRAKVGTKRTAWDMSIYAIPRRIEPNLARPRILYDHVNG